MPTRATSSPNGHASVGDAAKRVADHAKALAGLEVELATAEMKRKAGALGLGIGLFGLAGLLGVYAVGFLLATVAAALALTLDLWLSLLLVGLGLVVLIVVLALVGRWSIRRATPPLPEQAITEAKLTSEAIKS
jgi:Putative Actinobacterial Holin-X, holin superfamily III